MNGNHDKLISVDKLKDYIMCQINLCGRLLEGAAFGMRIMDYIDDMPAAFDLEKVIERLEEEREESYVDFAAYAEEKGLDEENDWHFEGLKRAIEIVKAGEVDMRIRGGRYGSSRQNDTEEPRRCDVSGAVAESRGIPGDE